MEDTASAVRSARRSDRFLFPLLRHLGAFLLMLGPHCNLTFLAAVPGTTAISTPFGWYSHVVGTIGVGAWLGGPVAGHAHLIRSRTTHKVEVCRFDTITAETNVALEAS